MERKYLILNEKEKAIGNIVNTHSNNNSLSCTIISHIYCDKYNDKLSNVSVYRILTKKLGFTFRKTEAKTK